MKIILLFLLFPVVAFAQNGPINIHLKSGEIISTRYAFLENNSIIPYVRMDHKKGDKITIDKVSHVEGTDQINKYKYFQPIMFQNHFVWGERTYSSERVNIFNTDIISGTWTSRYRNRYYQYQIDNRPLKKLKYSNLKKDIADNPESLSHLKKGNAIKITQFGLYGIAATLIGIGSAKDLNDNTLSNPYDKDKSFSVPVALEIAGAFTLYIPYWINRSKQKHYVNALKAYK